MTARRTVHAPAWPRSEPIPWRRASARVRLGLLAGVVGLHAWLVAAGLDTADAPSALSARSQALEVISLDEPTGAAPASASVATAQAARPAPTPPPAQHPRTLAIPSEGPREAPAAAPPARGPDAGAAAEATAAAPTGDTAPASAAATAASWAGNGPSPSVATAPPLPPATLSIRSVSYRVPPELQYPPAARQAQEQGRAWVRLLVDAAGNPQQVGLARSSGHPRLDEAAVATASSTRFQPHTENGVPRAFWVVMPFVFELEN